MHIAELLALRPVPAAGVFLTLTRRCPLTCAHCSTNSMIDSEEHSAEIFAGFAGTFTKEDHPETVWLTGGEPLLRPELVHRIAREAHQAGSKVAMITGMYFARRDGRIAPRLLDAMLAVDHMAVSHDEFHEVQVDRAAAFATVRTLLDAGQDVSFQLVGTGPDDPYLIEMTAQIRAEFDDRVPALVAPLGTAGRASQWRDAPAVHRDQVPVPAPCVVAAWPVVTFDGTVVACCQQRVVDGPAPEHLRLGTAPGDGWPAIAARSRERAALRALRTVGPEFLVHDLGVGRVSPNGYCDTCINLGGETLIAVAELTRRPTFPVMEAQVQRMQVEAGALSFARRYGIPQYAHMLELGLALR